MKIHSPTKSLRLASNWQADEYAAKMAFRQSRREACWIC